MKIKLIVSDIDGTILPHGGQISNRTKEAIAACERAGTPFVIASGRWFVAAKEIADAIGQQDGYIIVSGGGAVMTLKGEILQEWTLTNQQARQVYDLLRTQDVNINAFVRNAVYRVNTKALKKPPKGMGSYLGGTYHLVNDDDARMESEGLVSPYKMEAYSDDAETLAILRDKLVDMGFSVSSAYPTNIEIMRAGCGKGTAARWLAGKLGVDPADCMALGDNTNDLSMLSAVGWPIAVGNAAEKLKAAARIIAPDCADDGAAWAMEQALGGEIG